MLRKCDTVKVNTKQSTTHFKSCHSSGRPFGLHLNLDSSGTSAIEVLNFNFNNVSRCTSVFGQSRNWFSAKTRHQDGCSEEFLHGSEESSTFLVIAFLLLLKQGSRRRSRDLGNWRTDVECINLFRGSDHDESHHHQGENIVFRFGHHRVLGILDCGRF